MKALIVIVTVAWLATLTGPPAIASDEPLDPRLTATEQHYRQAGAAAALPEFEALLPALRKDGDARGAAIATGFIGECLWRLGRFDEARIHLEEALALKSQLGDRLQEGKTRNVLGLLEWDLGRFDQALERFAEAQAIGSQLGERKLEGAALNNRSMVLDELGDYRASLAGYEQVLDIYSGIDFPRGEGDTLGNIGGVHLLLGHYREAVSYYHKALEISERLGLVPAMSQDHGNLGLALLGLGRNAEATEHFERALDLARQAGMRQEQGFWLRGLANARETAGRLDLALENHRAAVALYEEDGARPLLLDARRDLGQMYLTLGDPESARQQFEESLALARELGSARGARASLLALGDLHHRSRLWELALSRYEEALERALESGELGGQVEAHLRLAGLHLGRERYRLAALQAEQAVRMAGELGARPLEAAGRFLQAELEREEGRPEVALAGYAAAQGLLDAFPNPGLMWQIEYGRARAQAAAGSKADAVDTLQRAVTLIEGVRERLDEQRFRTGYLQDKHQVYIDLVRLQLELGRNREAFSTAERMRAWSYREQSTGRPHESSLDPAQRQVRYEMQQRVGQLRQQLEEEYLRNPPDQRRQAMDTFSEELLAAERQLQAFLDDTRAGSAATPVAPPAFSLTAVQQALRPRDALVEYIVGPEQIIAFVATRHRLDTVMSPVSEADIYARLELLRDLIQQRDGSRWQKPAAGLARTLIEPILAAGWLGEADHLYLVPHGMLHYLPFALLPLDSGTDRQSLVGRFSLAYLPSAASLLRPAVSRESPSSMLALAPASSRLAHAADEARSIAALFGPDLELLMGAEATETAFKHHAPDHSVLHLATHGRFNKMNPLLSGLQLEPDAGNDGLLQVHEILDLPLQADLVTLSACNTAMGGGYFDEIPAGDEFVGLTRAFLSAGSATVLATLWPVDDRFTEDLMNRFYLGLRATHSPNDGAAALAAAQRHLSASGPYEHPYFWAPFVLVGSSPDDASAENLTAQVTP